MACLLQPWMPYDQSLHWQIHDRYFSQRGIGAWQDGEVPWYRTNNSGTATDAAEFLIELVQTLQSEGKLQADDPVWIMEVGSGIGHFAANLCKALDLRLDAAGVALLQRLRYVLSDFAELSIIQALKTPHLQPWVARGVIVPALYDLRKPGELTLLDRADKPPQLCLIIASYVCDVMPCKLLQRREGDWFEQIVQICAENEPDTAHATEVLDRLLNRPIGDHVLPDLNTEFDWQAIDLATGLPHPLHAPLIEHFTQGLGDVSLAYHYPFFEFLQGCAPVLRQGGAVLVNDWGPVLRQRTQGRANKRPSLYGNSMSHEVAFGLFDALPAKTNWQVLRTHDALASLQTVALRHDAAFSPQMTQTFDRVWVQNEHGEDFVDLSLAARVLNEQKHLGASARFFRRLLRMDPGNVEWLYKLGDACLDASQPEAAKAVLLEGFALDTARAHDFEFQIGRACAHLEQQDEAVKWYTQSLEREDHPTTHANLGALHEARGEFAQAYQSLQRALAIEPEHPRALETMESLKLAWWQEGVKRFEAG